MDANVIVSGLLFPGSLPSQALSEARKRGELLLSDKTVDEIVEVLRRPKFDRYLLPEERDRLVAALIHEARHVLPTERISVCRDPKDDKWLELAVSGNAMCLVTGDEDLLALDGYRGLLISSPTIFIRSLAE